jgi:hypothetical protein
LKDSDPDVTFTAFLLSAELFATYVAGGRTGLRESQFTEVRVKVKQYQRPAYLYVPTPSQGRTSPSAPEDDSARVPSPAAAAAPSISGITISGDGSQNAFGNTVGGDFRQERS